jgi:hypothetical protein
VYGWKISVKMDLGEIEGVRNSKKEVTTKYYKARS